jgi:hypothetical protein
MPFVRHGGLLRGTIGEQDNRNYDDRHCLIKIIRLSW